MKKRSVILLKLKMWHILLLCVTLIFGQTNTKIIPSPKPIILKENNISLQTDYTFYFYLENDSFDDYQLWIEVPLDIYSTIVPGSCTAYLISNSNQSLPCTINNEKIYVITVGNLASGSQFEHAITVEGFTNHSTNTVGSGNFKLSIRNTELNIYDYNDAFGLVGYNVAALSFNTTPTVSRTSGNTVNTMATYRFSATINTTNGATINPDGRITLKMGENLILNSASTTITINSGFTPAVKDTNFTVEFLSGNLIDIKLIGTASSVSTTIQIDVSNVQNQGYAGSPGTFDIYLWENKYLNNQLNSHAAINCSCDVTASTIDATDIALFTTNFDRIDYLKTPSNVMDYEFYLKINNNIPQGGGIKIYDSGSSFSFSKVWSFQNIFEISETSVITYYLSGSTAYINNVEYIVAGTVIGIGIQTTNPSSANTYNIEISTYKTVVTATSTDQIDVTNPKASIVIISSYTSLSACTVAATAGTITAYTLMDSITLAFAGHASGASAVYTITFDKDFIIEGTGAVLLNVAGGSDQSLTAARNSNQEVVVTYTSGANANNDIVIKKDGVNGIKAPKYAGIYRIDLTIDTSGTDTFKTAYLTVEKQDLTLSSMIAKSYTKDYDHISVMSFSFYVPYSMESGAWKKDDNYAKTYMEFVFPTQISGQNIFGTGLGITPIPDPFPCYSILGLTKNGDDTGDNLLKCKLTAASAVGPTNFVTLKIQDYGIINKEGLATIHLPGVYNPNSQSQAPTVDINIYRIYRGVTTKILSNTVTMSVPTTYNIFSNAKNTNGSGGISTNESPSFSPNTINTSSYQEVKITVGRAITAGGGFIVFAPALPTTDPQYSLLPSQATVSCTISDVTNTCYSYPLKHMLLIIDIKSNIALNEEVTIKVNGCTNAPYVVNLNTFFTMWSYENTNVEHENFIFLNLPQFDSGSQSYSKVLPVRYESLAIDVEYEWVFVLGNNVSAGGRIILTFGATYYDLESSSPCPIIELVQGVTWVTPENNPNDTKTSCSDLFSSSVTTITSINTITAANNVIIIKIHGVKNPASEGWTPYFQIETQNSWGYTIDKNTAIDAIYITRALSAKNIVYNHFYMIPSNGNPSIAVYSSPNSEIRGTYYLSFYPQTTIPVGGVIEVSLPDAEFSPTNDYPTVTKCNFSGSQKSISGCIWSTTQPKISMTVLEEVIVWAGMDPVNIILPGIKNFVPELSSGTVKVTTTYDSINLDESSDDATNRKATTANAASEVTIGAFSISPKNEGSVSTLTTTLQLAIPSTDTSWFIIFEFPYDWPKGLGEKIRCTSTALELDGGNDPLKCEATDWQIKLTNHKGWGGCSTGSRCSIDIKIYGIINPNYQNTLTSSSGIGVFIYKDQYQLSEYNNIINGSTSLAQGAFFTKAPPGLLISTYTIDSSSTRTKSVITYSLTCFVNSTGSNRLYVHFHPYWYPEILTPESSTQVSTYADSNVAPTVYGDSLELVLASSYGFVNSSFNTLTINNVYTPFESGKAYFPILDFTDASTNASNCKLYQNLLKFNEVTFSHPGILITVNGDTGITLRPGTYTDAITVETATAPSADLTITPTSPSSIISSTLQPFTIKSGETTTTFRFGGTIITTIRDVYIYFSHSNASYAGIRPLLVTLDATNQVLIKVTEFDGIPAGGFTIPQNIFLDKGPMVDLTVGMYQIGITPDMFSAYPVTVKFSPGEKIKYIWLSTDYASKGSTGSVVITLTGTERDVYSLPIRKRDFFVYTPRTEKPVIVTSKVRGPYWENNGSNTSRITVELITNTPTIVYFGIVPGGTLDLKISEIREKKLRYDNFYGKYFLGESIQNDATFKTSFEIKNIPPGYDQYLKIFVQNFDGNYSNKALQYNYTTEAVTPPGLINIRLPQTQEQIVVFDALKQLLTSTSQSRITMNHPDNTNYYEVYNEGIYGISWPTIEKIELSGSKKSKFNSENNKRLKLLNQYSRYFNTANTYSDSTDTTSTTTIWEAGDLDIIQSISQQSDSEELIVESYNAKNENRQNLNPSVDVGMDLDDYNTMIANLATLQSRTYNYSAIGDYTNNTDSEVKFFSEYYKDYYWKRNIIERPKLTNDIWLTIFVTADITVSVYDIIFQLEDALSTLKGQSTYADVGEMYWGFTQRRWIEWSAMNLPYIEYIDKDYITINGIASSETATLYWIAVETSRINYDAKNTIDASRIRYLSSFNPEYDNERKLSDLDSYCTAQTYINELSQYCDGAAMPLSSSESDATSFYKLFANPSGWQIESGLDMNNYKAQFSGSQSIESDTYYQLNVTGLNPGTGYVVFVSVKSSATDGSVVYNRMNETIELIAKTFDKEFTGNSSLLKFVRKTQVIVYIMLSVMGFTS